MKVLHFIPSLNSFLLLSSTFSLFLRLFICFSLLLTWYIVNILSSLTPHFLMSFIFALFSIVFAISLLVLTSRGLLPVIFLREKMTNNTQILPLHFIFLVDLLLLSPWKKKQLLDYFESGVTHKKRCTINWKDYSVPTKIIFIWIKKESVTASISNLRLYLIRKQANRLVAILDWVRPQTFSHLQNAFSLHGNL